MKYEVMTLDAMELFQFVYETNDLRIPDKTIVLDMQSPYVQTRILKETEDHEDTPLFYQMRECLAQIQGKDPALLRWGQSSLKHHIVFIDFSRIYTGSAWEAPGYYLHTLSDTDQEESDTETEESKGKRRRKDVKGEKRRKDVLKILFCKGLTLHFAGKTMEEGENITFMPFDKSASMSRRCRISFVDKDLLTSKENFVDLEKRVCLGIDFSKIRVVNSKYLAYRGLYLSNGTRIENEDLRFNRETVVVLPSNQIHDRETGTTRQLSMPAKHHIHKFSYITITSKEEKKGEEKETFDYDITEVSAKDKGYDDSVRWITAFDGEGLVDPEYCSRINVELRRQGKMAAGQEATSFQIRMPFTKGMLHSVDFRRFIACEILPQNSAGDEIDPLPAGTMIYDAFGIRRDLSRARIILTESMFKACDWLKSLAKTDKAVEEDPMKYYFDRFHAYRHALYVCQTDLNYARNTARLTYQFLNPLDISADSLKKVVDDHIDHARSIAETRTRESAEGKDRRRLSAWEYALASNPDFFQDPYIARRLEEEQGARLRDVALGRLEVPGCQRYLSCDLLAFLIYMADCLDMDATLQKEQITLLKKEKLMKEDRFYLPGSSVVNSGLSEEKFYGFLRSPHLSRNEECVLRPWLPETRTEQEKPESLYTQYFSNLTGIVMISYESNAALVMGGADYDGDTVQIIFQEEINDAILSGVYQDELTEEDKNGESEIRKVRKLPIAVIPSEKAKSDYLPAYGTEPYYAKLFDTVHTTFVSHVGKISNGAVRLGMEAYGSAQQNSAQKSEAPTPEVSPTPENRCALCTVIAGLDIDAAKTGRRPRMPEWLTQENVSQSSYISVNNKLKNLDSRILRNLRAQTLDQKDTKDRSGGKSPTEAGSETKQTYIIGYNRNPIDDATFQPLITLKDKEDSSHRANLLMLPQWYAKALIDRRTNPKDWQTGSPASAVCRTSGSEDDRNRALFHFQLQQDGAGYSDEWKKGIDSKQVEKLSCLLHSYDIFNDFKSDLRTMREDLDNNRYVSHVYNILRIEYDLEAKLDSTAKAPSSHEVEIAYSELRNICDTKEKAEAALRRLAENRWAFVCGQEEQQQALQRILYGDDRKESSCAAAESGMCPEEKSVLSEAKDERKVSPKDKESAASPAWQETEKLLLDPSEYGYWFLFYILEDLKTEYAKGNLVSKAEEDKGSTRHRNYDPLLLQDLVNILKECESEKKPMTKRVNTRLMEGIRDIFKGDLTKALMTLVYMSEADVQKRQGDTATIPVPPTVSKTDAKRAEDFLWQVFAEDHREFTSAEKRTDEKQPGSTGPQGRAGDRTLPKNGYEAMISEILPGAEKKEGNSPAR